MILFLIYLLIACQKDNSANNVNGKVHGTITDNHGTPLNDVKIIVDNSIFFNTNLSTKSNSEGKYSLNIPQGSWYAFAIYKKIYKNKVYEFYLHPDNSSGFGGEGAIRNFVWKLIGQKTEPLVGHYGGLVTIDNYPGYYIDPKEILFTFTPTGNLIDGSQGVVLNRKAEDGFQIQDIPMGTYSVTAKHNGHDVLLRKWNSDDAFVRVLTFDFEPQIAAQCDNCFKIQYNR